MSFDVSNSNNGRFLVYLGSQVTEDITNLSDGTYTLEGESIGNNTLVLRNAGFEGSIDNVSVKEITDDTDIPRINYEDFSYTEESSTNLVPYSEDFSQWTTLAGATKELNYATAPDGSNNAAKVTFDGTIRGRIEDRVESINTSGTFTFSVWLKTESGTLDVQLGHRDWGLGVVTVNDTWQRFEHTSSNSSSTSIVDPRVRCDSTGSVLMWGYQLEEKPYATSYIPTNGQH